jgi:DHA2 family multidrug resistance protein-like MFS transporter
MPRSSHRGPGETPPPNPRRWVAVAGVGLALLMSALDGTIVALALPTIATHFAVSASLAAGVFLAYAIPLTVLILPAGAWIARYPARTVFAVAALGFAGGSALCGVAPSFSVLLAGRALQGGFAAVLTTQGFAVAAGIVRPDERGRALGLVGALAPLGGILGPGLGGFLIGSFGFRSVFFVNVPIALVAATLGAWSLAGFRVGRAAPGGTFGAMRRLLVRRPFLLSLLAFGASVCGATALYYVLPFSLWDVERLAPSVAGALLLAIPLGMAVAGPLGGTLTDRYGGGPFIVLGAGLFVAGLVLLVPVVAVAASPWDLLWRFALIGVAIGLFTAPTTTRLMSLGPRESMGAASALTNLAARLGAVVGPLTMAVLWSASPAGVAMDVRRGTLELLVFGSLTWLFALLSMERVWPWGSAERHTSPRPATGPAAGPDFVSEVAGGRP